MPGSSFIKTVPHRKHFQVVFKSRLPRLAPEKQAGEGLAPSDVQTGSGSGLRGGLCHMEMFNGQAHSLRRLPFIFAGFEHDAFKAR